MAEEVQKNPLVSIVVAFYNVESCVHYCMKSLSSQSFDDYEVVCVDDGSTDNTGRLLDQYSSNPHVRVVHKSNGGLSDARNCGVLQSRGRYITFVDGDDIVAPHYLSSLVDAMQDRGDRMVIGIEETMPFSVTSDLDKVKWGDQRSPIFCSKRQVVEEILYDRIHPTACAKLAPREVYLRHPFPVGCYYEEIKTVMEFIDSLNSFVVLPTAIYGYIMRNGSITWSTNVSVNQLEQYQSAAETITSDALKMYPDLTEAAQYQKALLFTRMHSQLPLGTTLSQDVEEKDIEIRTALKQLMGEVKKNKSIPIVNKWRMQLLVNAPHLYDAIYAIYRKKIKGVQ